MLFPSKVSLIVSLFSAALCCQLPLLNLLGYESAAFFGVICGLSALMNVNSGFKRGQLDPPTDTSRRIAPGREAIGVIIRQWGLLLLPFLILTANAYFVRKL